MDRNICSVQRSKSCNVALRKESVDRNEEDMILEEQTERSLSARRAWIEMQSAIAGNKMRYASLSARRAWIEMRLA